MLDFFRVFILGGVFLFSQGVAAAPPQTLDYQGYLADSGDVPITGSASLSVALYDADIGGTALWTQAGVVSLTNGRFTLLLDGTAGNPFPPSLFDQQLYVGLTVNADSEMTPRQPFASVPSAFEAINADTVDGLHASEIIDAAGDEVRTPISSLPFTVNTPGSYYVTQDLSSTGSGITVNVDNVTLDLMGFALDGNGTGAYGIFLDGRSRVVIKNGTIQEFGFAGIYSINAAGTANVVMDVQVIGNGSLGATQAHSGVHLGGNSNRVERCIAKDNGGHGIFVGINSIVKDSTAENSGGTYGIFGAQGSTLSNNTAAFNQGTYGIYGHQGSVINGNAAYSNQHWGISGLDGSTLRGNSVVFNNQSQTAGEGGMQVTSSTQAVNNTATFNYDTGIYVSSANNVLRDNHATGSISVGGNSRCFNFGNTLNAAIGNTATGCVIEFAGSLPAAARYIDNIGW